MKNSLLRTTALTAIFVSAGAVAGLGTADKAAAAEVVTSTLGLEISGSLEFQYGYIDVDRDEAALGLDAAENELRTDTELEFTFRGRADNGLTYGANLELEADPGSTGNADEVYGFVVGTFGQVEFGSEDGAADKEFFFAPADFGTGGVDGDYEEFVVGPTGVSEVTPFDSGDATKISYYTPRFSGFRAAVSWAPVAGSEGQDVSLVLQQNRFEDIFEVGASYATEFQGVAVNVGAVYVTGEAQDAPTGAPATVEDLEAYGVGAQFGYAGFTVGGSYFDNQDSGVPIGAVTGDDNWGYSLGAQYRTGPIVIGTNFSYNEVTTNVDVAENGETTAWAVGATYAVAPGLNVFAKGVFFEFDSDAAVATADNEGTVVLVGSQIAF